MEAKDAMEFWGPFYTHIDSEPDYSTHSQRDNIVFLRQTVFNGG